MIIDGRKIAESRIKDLHHLVQGLDFKPKLVGIMVGDNPASRMYLNLKKKRAEEVGMISETVELPGNIEFVKLIKFIKSKNEDKSVTGILVQLPLPRGFDTQKVLRAIDHRKDVDGLTGRSDFLPATVKGILTALSGFTIAGQDVTIIGRSPEVGKPLALAMIDLGATVTVCNRKTQNLKLKTKTADILISAAGHPGLVTKDMVKRGAIVIDVGSPKGDVDFEGVSKIALAITPVPGGVGPLTIISLFENTFEAARLNQEI